MLKLIGLIILWPVVTTLLVMIFNTIRVKAGADINDSLSHMFTGLIWGPVGILLGLLPFFHFSRFIGGIAGTYWGYQLYQVL